jgi:hypothetical protein
MADLLVLLTGIPSGGRRLNRPTQLMQLPLPLLERGAIRSGGGYRQAGW